MSDLTGVINNLRNERNFDAYFPETMSKAFDKARPSEGKKNLYIAGPWFDEKAEAMMINVKELFEQYKSVSAWEPYFPMDHTNTSPYLTFKENIKQINDCDAVLALISRKDIGTAFEIGYAKGIRRDVYILVLDDTDFKSKTNIMLAYSTNRIIQFKDMWKFILDKLDYTDFVHIDDTWENKE